MLTQPFLDLGGCFLDKLVIVAMVVFDGAVATDEAATVEAEDIHWLLVFFARLKGWLRNDKLPGPSLLKLVKR